ncbi:hypothetical protein ACIP28_07685 [Streptomyces albidoflavus]
MSRPDPDCQVCIAYAIAENDLVQHEVEASVSFDDWYEALTEMRDAHIERAHPGPDTDV